MKAFGAFLELLLMVVRSLKQRFNQKERDNLEANPADWFDSHFDGVSDNGDKTSSNKTNSANSKAE